MNKRELETMIKGMIEEAKDLSKTNHNGFEYPELPGKGKFIYLGHELDSFGSPVVSIGSVGDIRADWKVDWSNGFYNVILISYNSDDGYPGGYDGADKDKRELEKWANEFYIKNKLKLDPEAYSRIKPDRVIIVPDHKLVIDRDTVEELPNGAAEYDVVPVTSRSLAEDIIKGSIMIIKKSGGYVTFWDEANNKGRAKVEDLENAIAKEN